MLFEGPKQFIRVHQIKPLVWKILKFAFLHRKTNLSSFVTVLCQQPSARNIRCLYEFML